MSNSSQSQGPAHLTEPRYVKPLMLITTLFFLWAFGVNLNDILIPRFKNAFNLSDFQSSFIQVAFYGGYCLTALPAGRIMERIGYKRGILTGLALCATGALLFVPASASATYEFFLVALFIMASGQSFLEVAANPYVTILGPSDSAERRLNLSQSFNAVGYVSSMLLGLYILQGQDIAPQQRLTWSAVQEQAYRAQQASSVRLPYALVACMFICVAVLILRTHLPDVVEHSSDATQNPSWSRVFSQGHLVKGVVAQFCYVGAQVGVASFVIRFAQHTAPYLTARRAWFYLLGHAVGFMIGRFSGSAMMKRIAPARLLATFAAGCLVCAMIAITASGMPAVLAIVLIGFFHSIMFPTIFALGIRHLGPLTKRGSSLMVVAISGGAVFPAIMGRISDASSIQTAFIVPLICYVYILYFGMAGYKPSGTFEDEVLEAEAQNA